MNIAIIGSKQSRDIFDIKNIEKADDKYNVVSCFFCTSMLSVMSEPVLYNYRRLLMAEMSDFQMERWYNELEKNMLKTLLSKQPDVLLLDFFADARYGARAYGSEYITNTIDELVGKGIIVGKNLGIIYSNEQNTDDFVTMWKNFFDRFMAFISENLPNTQIVINTIKATNVFADEKGKLYKIPKYEDKEVELVNSLWRELDSYAIRRYKLKAISFDKEHVLKPGYDGYLTDLQLVNFNKEYYKDSFERFVKITKEKEGVSYKESNVNLVSDSAYKHQLAYWSNMAGKYEIVECTKYRALRIMDCKKELGQYSPQIWSRPIAIEGNGETEYTLSFYIKIPDIGVLNKDEVVFRIRTFKYIKEIKAEETIDWYRLTLEGHSIKENEEYRYIFTFTPKGNYIKLAPFMLGCIPGIEYSRIKLERSAKASNYTK